MGFIRGFFVVVISVLLFVAIFSMSLFLVVGSSLSYENVQQNSEMFLQDFLNSSFDISTAIDSVYPAMQIYCNNNPDYVFSAEGYTFDISCETVLQGKDAIIHESVGNMINQIYYKEYDCDFISCIKDMSLEDGNFNIVEILISEIAYDYWNEKFYFLLGAVFLLSIALFVFVEKKTNSFIILGSMLILSSLIFGSLESVFSAFSNNFVYGILKIFFSESFPVALRLLIVGVVFVVTGIIFKLFRIGFKIKNLFSKTKEKTLVVQKEVQKKPAKKRFFKIKRIKKKKK